MSIACTRHHLIFGQCKELKRLDVSFTEIQLIYSEKANTALLLRENECREIISTEYMVFDRMGLKESQGADLNRSFK